MFWILRYFCLPGAREVSKKLPGGRTIHFHRLGARGEPWRPISGTGTFDTFASCSMSLAVDKPKTSAVDGAETSPVDRAETSAAGRAETPVVDKAETSAVDTAETSAVDETETLLLAQQKVFCDQANTCAAVSYTHLTLPTICSV